MTASERAQFKSYVKSLRKRASQFEAQAHKRAPELSLRQTPEGGNACALRMVAAEVEEMLAGIADEPGPTIPQFFVEGVTKA